MQEEGNEGRIGNMIRYVIACTAFSFVFFLLVTDVFWLVSEVRRLPRPSRIASSQSQRPVAVCPGWRKSHLSSISNVLRVVSSDFCATLYIIMAISMWLSSHPKSMIYPFFCGNVSFVCGTFCDIVRMAEWFRNWRGFRRKLRWFYRVTIPLFTCKIARVRAEIWNDPFATHKYYTNLPVFFISSGNLLTLNISHILIYFSSIAVWPRTYISVVRSYTWLQSSPIGSTFRMLVSGIVI